MKILTSNFLTCAVKACKTSPLSYPLHFRDAELESQEMEYSALFIRNILPRIEWEALRVTAGELGFTTLPPTKPEPEPESKPEAEPRQNQSQSQNQSLAQTASISESSPRLEIPAFADEMEVEGAGASTSTTTTTTGKDRENEKDTEALYHDLHKLLLETQVVEGKMVCGNCGHEYKIKEGIANFLLPNHLV